MMTEQETCGNIINQLRNGVPPELGVERYSVGHEKLIEDFKKHVLAAAKTTGMIRYVSGSWGNGKTHLFRLLRNAAYDDGFVVSYVQLSHDETPLSNFQKVFSSIIRQVSTPELLEDVMTKRNQTPFGDLLHEAVFFLSTGVRDTAAPLTAEQYHTACQKVAADRGLDNDLRKLIGLYWQTYLPDTDDEVASQNRREELMQWFSGEGRLSFWQKQYGLMKIVSKDNAKRLLESLGEFVRLAGYNGMLILFDEAEQSYSQMTRTVLRVAQDNLLSLVNNMDGLSGMVMIYATTPDFFSDPKHGVKTYGALEQRIGQPTETPPRALDRVWNVDAAIYDTQAYYTVAHKVRDLYATARPESAAMLPEDADIDRFVSESYEAHSPSSQVSFWRELITMLVTRLDDAADGQAARPAQDIHDDVVARLKDA
jgi:hypothetical protein